MDGEVMLVLAIVSAPLAAAITSVWPSRATRWAARTCLVMAVVPFVLVGVLWWGEASREPPPRVEGEFVESGDDSGVIIAMSAVGIAAGVVNFGGWALASARAPRRDDLPPPPSTSAPDSGP